MVALCLLAATIFWFLNALNKEYTTEISYPIRFSYDNESFVSTEPLPQRLTLNATGYGWTLLRKTLGIKAEPIIYRIENPLGTRFLTAAALLPTATDQLKEIKINFIENDTIFTDFEPRAFKHIAVQVDSLQVELRENYLITSPVVVSPDTITFKGPASLIKKLPDVLIMNVPGKEIDENYDEEIPVAYTQDPLITQSAERVEVRFGVSEFVRETQNLPIETVNFPEKKSIELPVREVMAEYWVLPEDATKATPASFRVTADYKSYNRKDSTVVLTVQSQPDFVRSLSLQTQTLKLVQHSAK